MKSEAKIIQIKRAVTLLKALAHPLRLRIVECLERQELSVNEISESVNAGQVAVSKQLAVLSDSGILGKRAKGNQRIYFVSKRDVFKVLGCIQNKL